jgi:hypothetical protein
MLTGKKRWSDLSPTQRKAVVVGGAAELLVSAIAAIDLYRRDASQVRGRKALWLSALAIQPFRPLGCLLVGK